MLESNVQRLLTPIRSIAMIICHEVSPSCRVVRTIVVSSSQHSESKSLIAAAATAVVIVIAVPAAQISATAAASAVSDAINLTCTSK